MLKGEAETTIKLTVQLMESQGLSQIAKKYDLLNKNFMTKPLMVRILGTNGSQYPIIVPEDIRYYNCDFIFKGASAYVNREIRLAQLTKMMDVMSKMPALMNQIDPQKIVKMIANTLGFDENEFMRAVNPQLQKMGMNAQLNGQGLGGQPGQVPGMGGAGGQDALSMMANQGLPLTTISGVMNKMQGGQVGP
jgi:2-hydroxychromene-2-carboxylate isomerase